MPEQTVGEAREAVLGLSQCEAPTTCGCFEGRVARKRTDALIAAVRAAVLTEAQRIVEAEEELDGEMPTHINTALSFGPRQAREAILRKVVRDAKWSILAKLRALQGGGVRRSSVARETDMRDS